MDNEIAINETSEMTSQTKQSNISGLGSRLRKARESMHLTQKEAAARLYLNPKIIEVIEEEAFSDGPPMTFMRGYIRSYARLLNVPEGDIKAAIENLEPLASSLAPTTLLLQTNLTYRGDRYIRWITYLIILILVSLVILWWSSNAKYSTEMSMTTAQTPTAAPAATTVHTTSSSEVTPPTPVAETQMPSSTPTLIKEKTVTSTIKPTETSPTPSATTTSNSSTAIPAKQEISSDVASPPASSHYPSGSLENGLLITTPLNISTVAPAEETSEKPAPKPKKKHRRHQYRPIENMEIPEPD